MRWRGDVSFVLLLWIVAFALHCAEPVFDPSGAARDAESDEGPPARPTTSAPTNGGLRASERGSVVDGLRTIYDRDCDGRLDADEPT